MPKLHITLLLTFSLYCYGWAEDNLIQNFSFEEASSSGLPLNWQVDSWKNQPDYFKVLRVRGGQSGLYAVSLTASQPDDLKLMQTVRVKPQCLYRLSGWIFLHKPIQGELGANLSVVGILDTSPDIRLPTSGWSYVELYGQTGPKQTEVTITLRVGGYGRLACGEALFDNIFFGEVTALPQGVKVVSFLPPQEAEVATKATERDYLPFIFLLALFFIILGLILFSKPCTNFLGSKMDRPHLLLFAFLAGLILRIVLALQTPGHPTDIVCFKSWSIEVFQQGFPQFYSSSTFKDYPPFYMYILYICGALRALFNLAYDSQVFLLIIKTPAILADLALAFLIYKFSKTKWRLALGLITLFNPALIINSAVYGQVDSIYALLVFLALFSYYRQRYILSASNLALLLAFKPQSIIFAPLAIFWVISWLAKTKGLVVKTPGLNKAELCQNFWQEGKTIGFAFLAFLLTFIIISLPFFVLNPFGLLELYQRIFSSYPYASLNAFNIYSLLGLNWAPLSGDLFFIPLNVLNLIVTAAIVLLAGVVFFKETALTRPFKSALFLAVGCFCFLANNHERYLLPALIPALILFSLTEQRSYFKLFLILSASSFLNQALVLQAATRNIFQINPADFVLLLGSLVTFLTTLWTSYLCFTKDKPHSGPGDREAAASAG